MKPPETYSQWCDLFEQIENWEIGHQNIQIIEAMNNGEIRWVSGVAERITQRLLTLINNRISKLQTFFSERLMRSQNQFDIEQLILLFRKELLFIKNIENLKILPEDLKKSLTEDFENYTKQMQQNLENNSRKDLTGMWKRILTSMRLDNI